MYVCKHYFYFQGKKLADDIANGIIVSNRSLVLQRVTKKAAGIFTCQATNAEGHSASNELQLNVKCKLHSFIFHSEMINPAYVGVRNTE